MKADTTMTPQRADVEPGRIIRRPPAGARMAATTSMKLDLDNYIPALILRLSNKVSSSASQLYRARHGVSVTEWRLLAFFRLNPWSTASQACAYMGLDKGAVSRSMAILAEGGWLESRPQGLRKVEYRLTAAGNKLHNDLYRLAMAREAALLKDFSDGDRELLVAMMKRMLDNLDGLRQVGREAPAARRRA